MRKLTVNDANLHDDCWRKLASFAALTIQQKKPAPRGRLFLSFPQLLAEALLIRRYVSCYKYTGLGLQLTVDPDL